jgi:hypothetical protein
MSRCALSGLGSEFLACFIRCSQAQQSYCAYFNEWNPFFAARMFLSDCNSAG